jgi:hypothetical protein
MNKLANTVILTDSKVEQSVCVFKYKKKEVVRKPGDPGPWAWPRAAKGGFYNQDRHPLVLLI